MKKFAILFFFLFLPQFNFSLYFLNALIIFIGTLSVLSYFFFSKEHKGILGRISKVGIIYLMIGFGAAFGYTVMSRISLLIGRIDFILNLPLINSILPK